MSPEASPATTLLRDLLDRIVSGDVEVVDLAQPLDEQTPVIQLPPPFANPEGFRRRELSRYDDRGPNWYWNDFVAGEHVGTHFDAPIHWGSGRDGDGVDTLPPRNMIGEACVLDVTERAAADPDYLLAVEDVEAFEREHGEIPTHAWVILRTGWGRYAQDPERFFNVGEDGAPHTPGFAPATTRLLAQERGVLGLGVETVGTDAGAAAGLDPPFPAHDAMHGANRYGLAQLANVDRLPPRGAIIVATPLKITGGSGSPVRAIALVSRDTAG